jgi:hypothetical protein
MPLVLKSSMVRRLAFQDVACHGDRINAQRGVEIFDDFLGCTVIREVFSTDDEQIAPLDPLPCPITRGMVGEGRNRSRRLVRP